MEGPPTTLELIINLWSSFRNGSPEWLAFLSPDPTCVLPGIDLAELWRVRQVSSLQ